MIKWFLGALLLLAPSLALAQNKGQIVPSGAFTPGHTVRCENSTCTVAVDGGGSAGSNKNGQGYLTEIGITNTGTPLCINDALINAVGGYHQICLGANALGGGLISYNAIGGASPLGLNINVNGTSYSFPGSGNGNVIGPVSPTSGDLVLWNGGTTVKDGGPLSEILLGPYLTAGPTPQAALNAAVDASKTFGSGGAALVFPPGNVALSSSVTETNTGATWAFPPGSSMTFSGGATIPGLTDTATLAINNYVLIRQMSAVAQPESIFEIQGVTLQTAGNSYEKNGIFVKMNQGDGSSSTCDYGATPCKDLIGVASYVQATATGANNGGRIFALYGAGLWANGASSGYGQAEQLEIYNNSGVDGGTLPGSGNAQYGLSIDSKGTNRGTAGVSIIGCSPCGNFFDGFNVQSSAVSVFAFAEYNAVDVPLFGVDTLGNTYSGTYRGIISAPSINFSNIQLRANAADEFLFEDLTGTTGTVNVFTSHANAISTLAVSAGATPGTTTAFLQITDGVGAVLGTGGTTPLDVSTPHLQFGSAAMWDTTTSHCGSLAGATTCLIVYDNTGAKREIPAF